jgi:hypothetical protein
MQRSIKRSCECTLASGEETYVSYNGTIGILVGSIVSIANKIQIFNLINFCRIVDPCSVVSETFDKNIPMKTFTLCLTGASFRPKLTYPCLISR